MDKPIGNKVKKYPYKDGIVASLRAVIAIIFGGFMLNVCIYGANVISDDSRRRICLVSIIIILCGVLSLLAAVKSLYLNRKKNKVLGGLAYKFDSKMEYKIYKSIGGVRKKKGEFYFEKYMEWKDYVEQRYCKLINNENFYRFINREYRNVKKEETIDKYVMIPIELLIPQLMISLNEWSFSEKYIIAISLLIMVEGILIYKLYKDMMRVHFLEDFIEIIYPKKYVTEND